MTGEIFTITKGYKVFQREPKGEPMDEPNEIRSLSFCVEVSNPGF
jgi:hypothetical protein